MNTHARMTTYVLTAAAMLLTGGAASAIAQTPLGSGFTYQGQLKRLGNSLNDIADFEFTLWNATTGGATVSAVAAHPGVDVVNGLFTVQLDFGSAAFTGDARWLEIAVTYPVGGVPVTLSPRQPITPAPYALHALNGGESLWSEGPSNRIFYDDGQVSVTSGPTTGSGWFNVFAEEYPGITVTTTGVDAPGIVVEIESPEFSAIKATSTGLEATAITAVASGEARLAIAARATAPDGQGTPPNIAGNFYATGMGGVGAYGRTNGGGGVGVHGEAQGSSGWGVLGESNSPSGQGVRGVNTSTTGSAMAVYGATDSPAGFSGYFQGGKGYFSGRLGLGTGTPEAKLHISGTPGVDGIMFPDGSLQTSAGIDGLWSQSASNISYTAGDVGIGVVEPDYALHVETNSTYGVYGKTGSGVSFSAGVCGEGTHDTARSVGVKGKSESTHGFGVHGSATSDTGTTYGVYGWSPSDGGRGVHGWASSTIGTTHGVSGESDSADGRGVYGHASATSGFNRAVYGKTDSPDGHAAYFEGGRNYFEGNVGIGIDEPSYPLHVETNRNRAISATTSSIVGRGVNGVVSATSGTTYGVYGQSQSAAGRGVYGIASATTGTTYGGKFECASTAGRGVFARVTATSGLNYGGKFDSASNAGYGVYGVASANSGTNFGLYGRTNSSTGFAGYFEGGKNYFEGAVGIGTESPAARLQVDADADQDGLRVRIDGVTKFVVKSDGFVNVGSNWNPIYQLEVSGAGSAGKPGGGSWASSSDRRLKNNIHDLTGSLDRLMKLRSVTFEYKDPDVINELHGERIGMIAQEVEEVFPDWVSEGGHGYKTLTFRGFEALAVDALRELRAEKDAQIEALHNENAEMRERLTRLEGLLATDKENNE